MFDIILFLIGQIVVNIVINVNMLLKWLIEINLIVQDIFFV